MRRRILTIISTVLLALGVTLAVSPGAAAGTSCPASDWGSLPEVVGTTSVQPVADIRTGRHPCFDRVVVDVGGPGPNGWNVQYVDTVTQQGSGFPYPVGGGARLAVLVHNPVHDWSDGGRLVFARPMGPVADVRGYDTLREVHFVGSFEGQTQFAIGTRAHLPFRVFELDGPGATSRIVIDVAHRWHAW